MPESARRTTAGARANRRQRSGPPPTSSSEWRSASGHLQRGRRPSGFVGLPQRESMSKELDSKTLCQLQSSPSLASSVAGLGSAATIATVAAAAAQHGPPSGLPSPTDNGPALPPGVPPSAAAIAMMTASAAGGDEEVDDGALDPEEFYAAIPEPPDGGWGWMIVAASFLCNMVVDGIAYTFGIFFPEFVDHFKAPKGTVAWVGSLLSGCYLSAGPLVSALTNRYGCRAVCIGGSVVACIAFLLSTIVQDVGSLMVTFGLMAGVGFGLIYLPAIVSVNQYFSKKRALATGIAVCGSGMGAFVFAPFCQYLLTIYNWKGALMILAGLSLNCAVFGALMRPLLASDNPHTKPLLQRIWEEKERQRQDSLCNSQFFLVQHADGTIEKRQKLLLNTEPGVHSTLYLDQWGKSPMDTPVITLSPIQEARPSRMGSKEDQNDDSGESGKENGGTKKASPLKEAIPAPAEPEKDALQQSVVDDEKTATETTQMIPSEPDNQASVNQTAPNGHVPNGGPTVTVPAAMSAIQEIAKRKGIMSSRSATKLCLSNITMGTEMRRNSSSPRMSSSGYVYTGAANRPHGRLATSGEVWKRVSQETVAGGPRQIQKAKKKDIARPMYRKDIFYSGSVVNLPEYRQSQGDVRSYVASVLTIPATDTIPAASGVDLPDGKPGAGSFCPPCLRLPASMSDTLADMLDMELLKNPAFVLVCVSNIVGMMGFCIPFMYIADSAVLKGIDKDKAAFLLSLIGITNMIGRLIFGWLSDLPQINCLLLNNLSLCLSGIAVFILPFCYSYSATVATCMIFGLIVAAYILLTSIILVELFGLDNLTNSFGLLSLCRGAACMVGPPLAGTLFDMTGSYDVPFFVSGTMLIVSGAMSFFIPCVRNTAIKPEPLPDIASPLEEIPEESDVPEDEEDNVESIV
ncbi:monocarboxylate transporter 14 isoform X3 [Dermacentor albipictus]|uniref:monocarboxylate transporter 14 isoform X3 n=1 Tax=Dermacentor albipictus TaxID=60249 RepID=UPI0038FC1130